MNNDSPRRAILAPFFLIVEKGFFPQSSLDHDAEIMQHRNHHRAGAPIDCSCLTCSSFTENDEVVAVEDFIHVGNILGKSWVSLCKSPYTCSPLRSFRNQTFLSRIMLETHPCHLTESSVKAKEIHAI